MISIDVKGLEALWRLRLGLDREAIQMEAVDITCHELERFMQIIRQDPNIPKEYKDALVLWSDYKGGNVWLAVYIPEKMKWRRFGRIMVWERYKCPIRKYYGGELTPEYTGPNYIKQLWQREKDRIVSNIRGRIVSYIRTSIGD